MENARSQQASAIIKHLSMATLLTRGLFSLAHYPTITVYAKLPADVKSIPIT